MLCYLQSPFTLLAFHLSFLGYFSPIPGLFLFLVLSSVLSFIPFFLHPFLVCIFLSFSIIPFPVILLDSPFDISCPSLDPTLQVMFSSFSFLSFITLFSLNPVIPFSIFFSHPLLSALSSTQSLSPLHHLRTFQVF